MNYIQTELDKILNNCRTLPLPYEQIQSALDRIDQLNQRIDSLHTQLTPPPPPTLSSPTTTRILDSSTGTSPINGVHHSSKRQVKKKKDEELCKPIVSFFVLIDENNDRFFLIIFFLLFLRGTNVSRQLFFLVYNSRLLEFNLSFSFNIFLSTLRFSIT